MCELGGMLAGNQRMNATGPAGSRPLGFMADAGAVHVNLAPPLEEGARLMRVGHDAQGGCNASRLLRLARFALFVEERPNVLGQLGTQKFNAYRFGIRAHHFVGGRHLVRLGIHDVFS
jgi:hypothetical protein